MTVFNLVKLVCEVGPLVIGLFLVAYCDIKGRSVK